MSNVSMGLSNNPAANNAQLSVIIPSNLTGTAVSEVLEASIDDIEGVEVNDFEWDGWNEWEEIENLLFNLL
jgi:hypothetical protein